jgi:hypothetical protein
MWPCRWEEHVASWLLREETEPDLVIRYEDMRNDMAATIDRLLSWASVEHSDAAVEAAVDAADFGRMRAMNDELKRVAGARPDAKEGVVRRGDVGGWRDELSTEALRLLEERYGWVMRQVGYETETY